MSRQRSEISGQQLNCPDKKIPFKTGRDFILNEQQVLKPV